MKAELDHSTLVSLLDYDRSSGHLTWKVRMGRANPGVIAGFVKNEYLHIRIMGRVYRAHRLAWFHQTGKWPDLEIDHKDRNKKNNRWSNLRLATSLQNKANSGLRRDNLVRCKGVSLQRSGNFRAKIKVNGKRKHLGTFPTLEQAAAAYASAASALHGEFART